MAGVIETFSDVYVQAKIDGVRCGTPLIRIYKTRKPHDSAVMTMAAIVIILRNKENGCFIIYMSFFLFMILNSIFIIRINMNSTTPVAMSVSL